jgi:putative transposase
MLRAYRYCLLPTDDQKKQLAVFFGCARFVFNLGLETKIAAWRSAQKSLPYTELASQLKELKDTDASWLQDCPSQSLQSALRNLDTAYQNFFRGAGFPKFKRKSGHQSIQFPQGVSVRGHQLFLPKLKGVDFIQHRPLGKGTIKTVTVCRTPAGSYFVSILIDNKKELPAKKRILPKSTVGVDLGLRHFAVLSNGSTVAAPNNLRLQLRRLRVEQRKLSRRFKKGVKITEQSNSWRKQKLIVARLYERITNQRSDFLHKLSTTLVRQYDTICLETLQVKGMVRNNKLSLSISDAGWSSFVTMLQYKADWYGKNILRIGTFEPSSKLCSSCENTFKELSLSDRVWTCNHCGTHHDRDVNAAKNIKNLGLRNKPVVAKVIQQDTL